MYVKLYEGKSSCVAKAIVNKYRLHKGWCDVTLNTCQNIIVTGFVDYSRMRIDEAEFVSKMANISQPIYTSEGILNTLERSNKMKIEREYLGTFPEGIIIQIAEFSEMMEGKDVERHDLYSLLQRGGFIVTPKDNFVGVELRVSNKSGLYNLYAIYEIKPKLQKVNIAITSDYGMANDLCILIQNSPKFNLVDVQHESVIVHDETTNHIYGYEEIYPQHAKTHPKYNEDLRILTSSDGNSMRVVRQLTDKAHVVLASFKDEEAKKMNRLLKGMDV